MSELFAESPPENTGCISSAGIIAGWPESVLALGAAGVTPAGQPPRRRRYAVARFGREA